jgi:hypothetical protein
VSFSRSGQLRWSRSLGDGIADGLALDDQGNIYLVGSFDQEPFLASFSSRGEQRWLRRFPFRWDRASKGITALAVDGSARIYLVGGFKGSVNFGCQTVDSVEGTGRSKDSIFASNDVFVTSFTAEGRCRWTERWGEESDDYGEGITVGAGGGIFVAGTSGGKVDPTGREGPQPYGYEAFLAEFSEGGQLRWSKRISARERKYCYSYGPQQGRDERCIEAYGVNSVHDLAQSKGRIVAVGTFRGTMEVVGMKLTSVGGLEAAFLLSLPGRIP